MSFKLYQQGPEIYIPILIFSLVLTVVMFGVFPFGFARVRKKSITKKKYNTICYAVNFCIMCVIATETNSAASGAPYLLWTSLFTKNGLRVLEQRGILNDSAYNGTSPEKVDVTDESQDEIGENNLIYTGEEVRCNFCRKCGDKLILGSRYCRKCGAKVISI